MATLATGWSGRCEKAKAARGKRGRGADEILSRDREGVTPLARWRWDLLTGQFAGGRALFHSRTGVGVRGPRGRTASAQGNFGVGASMELRGGTAHLGWSRYSVITLYLITGK